MKHRISALLLLSASVFCGCAYRHYLGMHGPSIKRHPGIHAGITRDHECLACHHPDNAVDAPATGHPGFKGCLNCHNDEVKTLP